MGQNGNLIIYLFENTYKEAQMKAKKLLLSLSVLLILAITNGSAIELIHRNLYEMSTLSKRIFVGKCISATEIYQPDSELPACIEYTFEVKLSIKGNVGNTITFRQFGLKNPRKVDKGLIYVGRVPGMPIYEEGKDYVLFLIEDSALGLTSPIGLFQGAFRITTDKGGVIRVVNGINNLGLFKELDMDKLRLRSSLSSGELELFYVNKGPVNYNTFISLLKKFVDEN